ncbi:hypothetical protein ACJJWD_14915 [Comamonas testosteroni]|uniref:hypothetical protein n=1 Tax=Comamonas testosteroni TaxID=285 RepID=UPI00389A5EBE
MHLPDVFHRTALCLLSSSVLWCSAEAQAEYLWVQPEGAEVRAYVGELHRPLEKLPALLEPKAMQADGKLLPAQAAINHIVVPQPVSDLRFTATGFDDGVLTYYQARYGRQGIKALNDLELVPTQADGNTFRLMFKGRPVAASQVNVETGEGWRRSLAPSKDGTVSFTPSFPGLYVLEVSARVNDAAVTVGGRKYHDVRYTATLSFTVPQSEGR